jgi:hypothetical protein
MTAVLVIAGLVDRVTLGENSADGYQRDQCGMEPPEPLDPQIPRHRSLTRQTQAVGVNTSTNSRAGYKPAGDAQKRLYLQRFRRDVISIGPHLDHTSPFSERKSNV